MAHLIAAYALAAIAILAYVAAILASRRRQRDIKPWLILCAFVFQSPDLLAAADSTWAASEPKSAVAQPSGQENLTGQLGGLVVDGANNDEPLSGAEVVLRGVRNDVLTPIATTRTDNDGHFSFTQLDVANGALYVAGVNRDGIHYPGPRVGLFPDAPQARVRLACFPGTSGDSPLVALRHEVDIQVAGQALEVTESILVMNPSLRGFAGADPGEEESTTLVIHPFPGFERVTFHLEQLGRSFQVIDGRLTTSLAWPPGQREIKFSYQLPIENRQLTLNRTLTLPTRYVQVRVKGVALEHVQANLADATAIQLEDIVQLTYNGEPLAAGAPFNVMLRGLSVPWTHHLRWLAPAGLALLVVGSLAQRRWRLRVPSATPNSAAQTTASQQASLPARSAVATKTKPPVPRAAARA